MGLMERLAARRPHVLLVPVPGATASRLATESAVHRTGGVLAASPADADVLVVAGEPGPELAAAVEVVWAQLPGPRPRVQPAEPGQADDALRGAVAALADPQQQVARAPARGDEWGPGDEDMPGGLAMAESAEDRDGLELEVLRVPLGPVLPDWPAGLVVDTILQGDVVQQAHARLLGPAVPPGAPFWHAAGRRAAARLDSLARLLAVAGWDGAALRAREIRDELLTGAPPEQVHPKFQALHRRVARSRALRWATDGLGDATARWQRWLTEAGELLDGRDPPSGPDPDASGTLLAMATEAMCGLDLAAARLLLASFDPDPDELAVTAGAPG